MVQLDGISLTRKLLSFNTINPPGNEAALAKYLGGLLSDNGFDVSYHLYEENRLHMVAEKGVSGSAPPLVFSGHFDTVPLGEQAWTRDPFSGEIEGDRIYGRGSSDMKSGIAAMTIAAIESSSSSSPEGGIRLIFTSDEELGCQGVLELVNSPKDLGEAYAIIVGEPTANSPAIGHKGALYINAELRGRTAHSSMPEMGDNAIYKAAKCITKIENFQFEAEEDKLLGFPTINVGKIEGGMNINSVPDYTSFTIDVRSTTRVDHATIRNRLYTLLGNDISLETLVDLPPVSTLEEEPFVKQVYDACEEYGINESSQRSLPYLTDGSVLQSYYKGVPTIILGPGEPGMAHKTDEYCSIENLTQSVSIYKNIILNRRK